MPWYRGLIRPNEEMEILGQRSKLSLDEMRRLQDWIPASNIPKYFTALSSFQYIVDGLDQEFFYPTKFPPPPEMPFGCPSMPLPTPVLGLLLDNDESKPRDVYWRADEYCGISDSVFKSTHVDEKAFIANCKNFVRKKETEIPEAMKQIHAEALENDKEWCENNGEEHEPEKVSITFTEAQFRYQATEPLKIVIDTTDRRSCLIGYAFAKVLEKYTNKRLKFSMYDAEALCFTSVSRETIKDIILGKNEPKEVNTDVNKLYESLLNSYKKGLADECTVPMSRYTK